MGCREGDVRYAYGSGEWSIVLKPRFYTLSFQDMGLESKQWNKGHRRSKTLIWN